MKISLVLFAIIFSSFNYAGAQTLETVNYVDIDRYLGKWYQIASIPQPFQNGCTNSRAEYSSIDQNRISVKNTCDFYGEPFVVSGVARIVDNVTNAKLKVKLTSPFEGDYWIIELDENYSWAVVGTPDRKNLWILSRSEKMSDSLYDTLTSKIASKHLFDLSKVERTRF